MLKGLGVKPTKQLPQNLIDSALDEPSANNIRNANEDAGQAVNSSRKISDRIAKIDALEMREDSGQDKLQ
jgi:hypothetical protein